MDGGQPSRRRDAARSRRIDQLKTEPVTWPTHAGCKGGIQGAGTGVTGRCNSVRNSRTGCQGRSYQTGCHAKRHSAAGEQALVNTLVNSKPRGTHRPGTQAGTHGNRINRCVIFGVTHRASRSNSRSRNKTTKRRNSKGGRAPRRDRTRQGKGHDLKSDPFAASPAPTGFEIRLGAGAAGAPVITSEKGKRTRNATSPRAGLKPPVAKGALFCHHLCLRCTAHK